VIRQVIDRYVLAPEQDDKLFELLVGFHILDSLATEGYQEQAIRLLPSATLPFAVLSRGPDRLTVWRERSLWGLTPSAFPSRYRQTLQGASMSLYPLRPDYIVFGDAPPRTLLVEVKLTKGDGPAADRRGIVEAMAYLHDAQQLLATQPKPHALVVAWGAEGSPAPGEIVVSDQHNIGQALASILGRWAAKSA
jgi:hypothetical protein